MKSSREIIRMLLADGWYLDRTRGDHHQFKHPAKPGICTVGHPKKSFPPKTYRSMEKQAGIKFD